jgi:membrane fusion protein (multidrug efflux system)
MKRFPKAMALAVILCACEKNAAPPAKSAAPAAPREARAVHAAPGPITRFVTLPAEIKALHEATLYAKVTGYLKTIAVDKGDEVKQGALLAEIEVPELLADAAKYKAEVGLADIELRRVSEARQKAPDLVVPLTVDTARSKAEVAKANLDRAEMLLMFTRITAPFSGIITRRNVDPGAFIAAATANSPQNAALFTLADFKTVRVQVAVPESDASLVQRGQPIKVTVEGLRGRVFKGQITRFSYALDDASKTMLAEIELPNPDLALRPGMYATASLGLEHKDSALLVPAATVIAEKANRFVFTLVGNKAHKTPVKLGFEDGENVEITNGVKPDDTVLLPVKGPLADAQPIKVIETK